MTDLKKLFTGGDFELLNQIIDDYPTADFGMKIFGEIVLSPPCNTDEEKEEYEREKEKRFRKNHQERKQKEEQCIELKFKLLQLKKMTVSL
ncbi:hypothetical protein [Chryseobacterium nematophagum]|uniref:hypothetical protein n=1 Tax=Chryseobacterium nematophagum TaxID=2305228 RepID=UPI00160543EB|nr:hypothetical protein [Chryseobacterium nematophagum]